jgi:hypothetical protein
METGLASSSVSEFQPQLETASREAGLAMEAKANEVRQTTTLKEETQRELEGVLPVLEKANEGVRQPDAIAHITQGVCILLKFKAGFKATVEAFTNEEKDSIHESTIQRLLRSKQNAEHAGKATVTLHAGARNVQVPRGDQAGQAEARGTREGQAQLDASQRGSERSLDSPARKSSDARTGRRSVKTSSSAQSRS